MAENSEANGPSDVLVYQGRVYPVESTPVVVDSDDGSDLIEVWVRRGEGIEHPSEG